MEQVIYGYIQRVRGQIIPMALAWLLVQNCVASDQSSSALPLPAAKMIKVELVAPNLHAIDFMRVKQCALKATILKSQTRIAQYATDSQLLLLDLEYLRLAPACIIRLQRQGMEALAHTLESARILIKHQLPGRIFNATLGAKQYRSVWQTDNTDKEPTPTAELILMALRDINQAAQTWLSGGYAADNLQFELQLSEAAKARVYYGDWHAQQLTEVMHLETLLQDAVPAAYSQWQLHRQERE